MAPSAKENKILVIYVGSRRLAGIVVEMAGETPRVLRMIQFQHPEGFQKGEATHLDKAFQSMEEMLKRLDLGEEAYEIPAYVLVSHPSLKMTRFSSSITYEGYPRAVTLQEVQRVIEQTRSVALLPLNEWVLQLVPESFWVNDLAGVENPVGLDANRLAVTLQIFTMNYGSFRNLSRIFENLEINVQGYYPKTLVLADGVLNPVEREHETLILDISEEVTHLVLTRGGKLAQTKSLDFGASALTNRIGETWQLGVHDAEVLMDRFGSFQEKTSFGEELIPLTERNGHKNHQIKRSEFHQAFYGFGEKFLSELHQEVTRFLAEEKLAYPYWVVTGRGAKLDGFLDLLGRISSVSVKLGMPRPTQGANELLIDPGWAGTVGLLRWLQRGENFRFPALAKDSLFGRTLGQVKEWLTAYF